jgi:hypothetical protein
MSSFETTKYSTAAARFPPITLASFTAYAKCMTLMLVA